jgi:chromosome segregation ATPase
MTGLLLKKFWREIVMVLMVIGFAITIGVYKGKIEDLNLTVDDKKALIVRHETKIAALEGELKGIEGQLQTLADTHQTLKDAVGNSDAIAAALNKTRSDILWKIGQINLKDMTCEEKFSWMKEQALGGAK